MPTILLCFPPHPPVPPLSQKGGRGGQYEFLCLSDDQLLKVWVERLMETVAHKGEGQNHHHQNE